MNTVLWNEVEPSRLILGITIFLIFLLGAVALATTLKKTRRYSVTAFTAMILVASGGLLLGNAQINDGEAQNDAFRPQNIERLEIAYDLKIDPAHRDTLSIQNPQFLAIINGDDRLTECSLKVVDRLNSPKYEVVVLCNGTEPNRR